MPITPIAKPRYPDVPRAPGVPPVQRNPLRVINDITLLVADAEFLFSLFGPPKWGIYDESGSLALFPDSIYAVGYRQDSELSTFPIEQGGFETYNKVATPFGVKVTMTKGGSDAERASFLDQVQSVADTMELFSIVMPDFSFDSTNVSHWDFERRGSVGGKGTEGVGLLTVDLWFEEIRVTGSANFRSTAEPSGADPVNNGTVQFTPGDKIIPVSVTPL